jgi:hypothetical protein
VPVRNSAPYDERNELDYREMSKRVADALEEIDRDPSIPATQNELVKRAKCSRGTLRNRRWPLERLKNISAKRKETNRVRNRKITLEHRTTVEVHIEDKRRLLEQLEKSRDEAAIWYDKYKDVESEKNKLLRINELLIGENTSLKKRVDDLVKRLDGIDAPPSTEVAKESVLHFPVSKSKAQKRRRLPRKGKEEKNN